MNATPKPCLTRGEDDRPLCECGCAQFKHLNDGPCRMGAVPGYTHLACACNRYRPRGGWENWSRGKYAVPAPK